MTVVHFDIPANDSKSVEEFYTELFGWEMKKANKKWLVSADNIDGEGSDICGKDEKRENEEQPISNYIAVASIDEHVKKIKKLGGSVLVEKTTVENTGYFAVCSDTAGNAFGIWEDEL